MFVLPLSSIPQGYVRRMIATLACGLALSAGTSCFASDFESDDDSWAVGEAIATAAQRIDRAYWLCDDLMEQGKIISIQVARTGGAPMETIAHALIVAGRGLQGDRYHEGIGTYSNRPGSGRHVTLIESEALEALKRDYGVDIAAAQARRSWSLALGG